MGIERKGAAEQPQELTLNVSSKAATEVGRLLSNFADAPFELNGRKYASVESFWQGLYFSEGSLEREQIAQMNGREAKRAVKNKPKNNKIIYQGQQIGIGSIEHHELMRQAVKAKLEQNPDILNKLLGTGEIRITHLVIKKDETLEPDSKSIPREIFSQILMELREEFRQMIEEQYS